MTIKSENIQDRTNYRLGRVAVSAPADLVYLRPIYKHCIFLPPIFRAFRVIRRKILYKTQMIKLSSAFFCCFQPFNFVRL